MRKYILLTSYVAVSLLIGKDFHPFSPFPMYNSFPNYSYAFYLKNERDELVPFRKNFSLGKNDGSVAHRFNAFFEYHHYKCGFREEEPVHLKEAGKDIMSFLLQGETLSRLKCDTLRLYKRYYHFDHDSINYNDDLMYEQAIRQ